MIAKSKKGQQLVEFALTLPIFIMLILLLVEVSLAFYSRMVFAEALKMSVNKLNEAYIFGGSDSQKKESIRQFITKKIYDYLDKQNMPYAGSVQVNINKISGTNSSVVVATYNYHPYFNLPIPPMLRTNGQTDNDYLLPAKFQLSSSQLVNDIFLRGNVYNTFTTKSNLANFNAPNTSTSFLKFGYANYDCMPPVSINARAMLGFLIGTTPGSDQYARLYNWIGTDLLPENLKINIGTGYMTVKSPYVNSGWVDTSIPYTWVLASLGITQAIYLKNNTLSFPQYNATDISTANYFNNAALGLDNPSYSSKIPYGSFDPLDSNTYNKIYNHSVKFKDAYNSTNYVIKLSLPSNNKTLPSSLTSAYKSRVVVTTRNGSFYQDITDVYIDNDGDGIPNAWDGNPGYADANANGILDGKESGPINFVSIADTVTGAATGASGQLTLRSPYNFSGYYMRKSDDSYQPVSITYSTTIYTVDGYNALYFISGSDLVRHIPYWPSVRTDEVESKTRFTNATASGSTLVLKKSTELDQLLKGPFLSTYKVVAN